jgi:hypothetical protein
MAAEAAAQAVRLLQRLLRGRALQNALAVGLAARRELIAELRTQPTAGLALAHRHAVRVALATLTPFFFFFFFAAQLANLNTSASAVTLRLP